MSSLNLDGSALSLMYMRTSSVCVILPALCRVTASELRDAGRQKPVTCLEPVLSVSRAQASISQVRSSGQLWHYPSLRLSLSVVARKSPGYGLAWDFSIPPRLVWARQPPSPSVLRVCMFRDENRVLDNVL